MSELNSQSIRGVGRSHEVRAGMVGNAGQRVARAGGRSRWLWRFATLWSSLRRKKVGAHEALRLDPACGATRLRPRFSQRLRDFFRPGWLRLARPNDDQPL